MRAAAAALLMGNTVMTTQEITEPITAGGGAYRCVQRTGVRVRNRCLSSGEHTQSFKEEKQRRE